MERSCPKREIESLELGNGNGNGDDVHGRGPCGEPTHAAALRAPFRRAGIVGSPRWWDRVKSHLDAFFTGVPQA